MSQLFTPGKVYQSRKPTLQAAFQIVQQLLAEKPRSFQELLKDGVGVHTESQNTTPSPSTSTSTSSSSSSTLEQQSIPATGQIRKGNMWRKKLSDQTKINLIPDGHPFHSANYLKKRILPLLKSQGAIFLSNKLSEDNKTFKWSLSRPPSSSSSASSPTSTFISDSSSALASSPSSQSSRPATSSSPFSSPSTSTANISSQIRRKDSPSGKPMRFRTEKEVWDSDDRIKGMTTLAERDHLNTRRARGRPEKERRALGLL